MILLLHGRPAVHGERQPAASPRAAPNGASDDAFQCFGRLRQGEGCEAARDTASYTYVQRERQRIGSAIAGLMGYIRGSRTGASPLTTRIIAAPQTDPSIWCRGLSARSCCNSQHDEGCQMSPTERRILEALLEQMRTNHSGLTRHHAGVCVLHMEAAVAALESHLTRSVAPPTEMIDRRRMSSSTTHRESLGSRRAVAVRR